MSPDWDCCRLMVGERRCSGKRVPCSGCSNRETAFVKFCPRRWVDGTNRSPRCAERSLTLPPTSVSGVQMPQKYQRQVPRTQTKASIATLNPIRCWIGSQLRQGAAQVVKVAIGGRGRALRRWPAVQQVRLTAQQGA